MTTPAHQGADIEIIDRHVGDASILVPSAVRINGVEIPMPENATIKVHEMSADDAVTVTLTLLARRITIAAQDETPVPVTISGAARETRIGIVPGTDTETGIVGQFYIGGTNLDAHIEAIAESAVRREIDNADRRVAAKMRHGRIA